MPLLLWIIIIILGCFYLSLRLQDKHCYSDRSLTAIALWKKDACTRGEEKTLEWLLHANWSHQTLREAFQPTGLT